MICPRCRRALGDGAKFCTACGQPLNASEASPAMAMRPPRFLAGMDNMLASGAWNEEFKDWLTVLRPRLVDAWGLDFVFDNGLCALLNEPQHKGDKGLFIEFTLFFDAGGNVLKPAPQEFIRWRPTVLGWRRVPVPSDDAELRALVDAMGSKNYLDLAPRPVAHQRKRPESGDGFPAWAVNLATRWKPHTLDPSVLLAHLDDIARILSSALSAVRTTASGAR